MSRKLTPAASTSTSSWRGPGSGSGASWSSRTSGPPWRVTMMARMRATYTRSACPRRHPAAGLYPLPAVDSAPYACPQMSPADGNGGTRDGQHVALVHDRLRDAILRGVLPAGQTTSQVTLARDLDVGRTPLREALRMLQREGLVVSEPNRRVRIAGLSSADAEELYVMRIALEAVAIRITVPTLTSTDFAELEGLMAQMDHYMRTEDRPGLRAPHRAFHDRLVRDSGERVTITIGQLFDHAERYRLAYGAATPQPREQRPAEHRAIPHPAPACGRRSRPSRRGPRTRSRSTPRPRARCPRRRPFRARRRGSRPRPPPPARRTVAPRPAGRGGRRRRSRR